MALRPQFIEHLQRVIRRLPFVITTVARYGIIDSHSRRYESEFTEVCFWLSMRVSGTINAHMMLQCELHKHVVEVGGTRHDLRPAQNVLSHNLELAGLI